MLAGGYVDKGQYLDCHALVKFIAGIIGRLTKAKWVTGKTVVIVTSIVITLLPFLYWLFSTGTKNYPTAYIQPEGAVIKITVKGKRMLMVHDLVSALLNHKDPCEWNGRYHLKFR